MKNSRSSIAILSFAASLTTMAFLAGCGSGLSTSVGAPGDLQTGQITSVQPNPIPQSDSPVLVQIQGGPFTSSTTLNFRDASGNLLIENQPLNSSSPETATIFASFANFPSNATVEIADSNTKQTAYPIALGGGNTVPTDYPYENAAAPNAIPASGVIAPDMWGFDIGQSTSYVAWKVNQSLGLTTFTINSDGTFHFDTTKPHAFWNNADSTKTVTETWGDASNWQQHAEDLNKIDPTIYWDHNPTAHSIFTDTAGDHVAWVEAVYTNSTGALVADLSEFDYSPAGGHQFSTRTIAVSNSDVFIHVLGSTPQAGYTFAVDPNDLKQTVTQGQSATFHVTVTSIGGFSAPVGFYAVGLPAGYASGTSWNPTMVTPAPNGHASSVFTLATNSLTATGTQTVTLKAITSNTSMVQEQPVSITVNHAAPVGDYSVTTPSTSISVKAGQSVAIPLTATASGGFAGTITPQTEGLAGFASTTSKWSPSAIVLTANGTGSSTFNLYANTTATPGTYPITLHTTSGSLSHDLTVNVTVTANPADYTLTSTNTSYSVKAGQAIGIPLTATGSSTFAGTITLDAQGWTGFGTTASKWYPTTTIVLPTSSTNFAGSSTFYLYTSSTATPGTYPVTLHTTSGSLSHDLIVSITVTPNPTDYSITTSHSTYTLNAGQAVGITLAATSIAGFTGTVTPVALGVSSFAATNSRWSPPTIVLSSTTGSTESSTYYLYASSTATPGTYPVTLHTTSGTLSHDLTVSVTVTANPADYSIATSSTSYTVKAGFATSITLTATSVNGFTGTITPVAQGLSSFSSKSSSWSPTAIVLGATTTAASGSSTIYFYANSTATPGTYPVTLHTTSGTLSHDLTVNVIVTANPGDYSIATPSTAVSVIAGQSVGITLTATSSGGFTGTITPSTLGLTGFAATTSRWSPSVINITSATPGSTGSSTYSLYANSTATPGTYPVTLHTTSGALSHDLTVNVTVTASPADYSVTTPSTTVSVKAGQAVGIPLTATATGGFTGTINLQALGWTGIGTTATKWYPASTIVLPASTANSSGTSYFYLYTNSTATPGTYPVTLHTTSGSLSHDVIVNVTVTLNAADYSIAVPSTAVSVKAGQYVGITLTATSIADFTGTITPSALGLSSFASTNSKWSPPTIVLTNPASGSTASSTIYVYANSTAALGTYPLTLHTSSGNLTHDITVNVTVTQ